MQSRRPARLQVRAGVRVQPAVPVRRLRLLQPREVASKGKRRALLLEARRLAWLG